MSKKLFKDLKILRRDFHQNFAELSGLEFRTSQKVYDYLKENTNAEIIKAGGTGVLAVFRGNQVGKTIMLRADSDALPITEINTFEHCSTDPQVSHLCGHDGHTVILMAVAELLTRNPLRKGMAILLWQPAEETGMGAKSILEDENFQKFKIDQVFALHNLPGIPLHKILYKKGTFTANVRSLILKFTGRTAHAAEPEHGENPALAIAATLKCCEKISRNEPGRKDFFLITPIYSEFGTRDYGISAGSGELHLTLRSWKTGYFENRATFLLEKIHRIAKKYGLDVQHSWTQEFYSNKNDRKAVDIIKKSAQELKLMHEKLETPFKWGEDFGLFTQKIPGAMFGIGSGENCPALHNPDYDFPDEITETAANLFYKILENAL